MKLQEAIKQARHDVYLDKKGGSHRVWMKLASGGRMKLFESGDYNDARKVASSSRFECAVTWSTPTGAMVQPEYNPDAGDWARQARAFYRERIATIPAVDCPECEDRVVVGKEGTCPLCGCRIGGTPCSV